MDRRRYLRSAVAAVTLGTAGCSDGGPAGSDDATGTQSETETPEETPSDRATSTPGVDTGVVYQGELRNSRDWYAEVTPSQTVTVTAENVSDGEEVQFQVGDGSSFVHSYTFYTGDSGTTDQYQFASDGRHQLQLAPGRADPPVDADVTVTVTIELSEP